jgi:hypothetical protein
VRRRTERVVALRAQGCTQTQIAERLGVAQSAVSASLSAAAARGALDPSSLLGIPAPAATAHENVTAQPTRSRASGLVREAQVRATAIAGHVRVLREAVVDADESTSDPLLAADVADAAAGPLAEAAGVLGYILAHLDATASVVATPANARAPRSGASGAPDHGRCIRRPCTRQMSPTNSASASRRSPACSNRWPFCPRTDAT